MMHTKRSDWNCALHKPDQEATPGLPVFDAAVD